MDEKEIRQQRDALNARLYEIDQARREERFAALVGRCFRYRNCYSCPTTDDDYWFLYSRVTGIKDGNLKVFRFQTDQYGKVEIEHDSMFGESCLQEEITPLEFSVALMGLRDTLGPTIDKQLAAVNA